MAEQRRTDRGLLLLLLSAVVGLALGGGGGCSTVRFTTRFLTQAALGQLEMANRARPIPAVIADERTPGRLADLLREIPRIKAFGERHGLKPTPNYEEYVRLDRGAATYVVSAAEPLSFKGKEWRFPVIGSVPYLGWFDRDAADAFARDLETQGWEPYVRGAAAYSTLGWFRDAVLSSMIPDGPEALGDLANVVLHESVHATLYVPSQSPLNESLASFVADRLTPIFLDETRGADAEETRAWRKSERESERRGAEFQRAYSELQALYASDLAADEKRARRDAVRAALQTKLGFTRPVPNAMLAQFRLYNLGEAEFTRLYAACGADPRRFLGAVRAAFVERDGAPAAAEQDEGFGTRIPAECAGS